MSRNGIFIVGCGSIGLRHIQNLRSLGVNSLIGFDPDFTRATTAINDHEIHLVNSIEEGFNLSPLATVICAPPNKHIEIAQMALENNSHLFIEKPISNTLSGIDQLISQASAKNLHIMVGYNLRYSESLSNTKAIVTDGVIGRIISIHAEFGQYLPEWRPTQNYKESYFAHDDEGGGIILDLSHEIDYVRWLSGEVTEITAMAGKLSDLEIKTEDTAIIMLQTKNRVLASIRLDCVQRGYTRNCKIVGTDGSLNWDIDNGITLIDPSGKATSKLPGDSDKNQMYVREMGHFLDCIYGKSEPLVDGITGKRILELALAAKTSALTGERILV